MYSWTRRCSHRYPRNRRNFIVFGARIPMNICQVLSVPRGQQLSPIEARMKLWSSRNKQWKKKKKYQSLLMKIAGFITHQTFSRNITCRNDINSERILVPEGVWTHNPPWSSRTLHPLSYSNWRLSLWWNNLISRYNFFALVGETVCSLRCRIKFVLTMETG